jgi:hypothetical protein
MPEHVENQMPLFFKLCSDHLSIEAIPRSAMRIDLKRMKDNSLREHELMMWTPHFVILRNRHGQEITLRKDGRMLVRKADSEEVAKQAAVQVMTLVLAESG